MNPNKFLVTITNLKQIKLYKKARITNFLFPLSNFCVGFPKTFQIEEIKEEGYLYINRILDTKAFYELKEILKNLPSNIKGLVFEDFGVITLVKSLRLNLTLILYQSHFGTNYKSINENLKYVDSIVISTDITKEEIDEILKKTAKPLVYVLYSLVPIMYSRRTLLSNFEKEFSTPKKNIVKLEEVVSKKSIIAVENEYGTIMYHDKYLNGMSSIRDEKIMFYFLNPLFMEEKNITELIEDLLKQNQRNNEKEDEGFLNIQTTYRLRGKDHE